jgi:hypothetical protein
MRFGDHLAGNAAVRVDAFLGKGAALLSMARISALFLFLVLLLAPGRAAADPLLSGYGGPGGGEQVVLGSSLTGGSGGSGGSTGGGSESLRATSAPAATQAPAASAPAATSTTPSRSSGHSRKSGDKHARGSAGRHPKTSAPAANGTPTPAAAGAPPVRAYPSRAADAGGLPLSAGDVGIALVALIALILAGTALRVRSDNGHDDSATAQATAC